MTRMLVLIQRTTSGSAYRYTRFIERKSDVIVETQPVAVGAEMNALEPRDVELFRINPQALTG